MLSGIIEASWKRRLALFITLTFLLLANASIKDSGDQLAESIHDLTENMTGYVIVSKLTQEELDRVTRIPGVKAVHKLTLTLKDNLTVIYAKDVPRPLLPVDKVPESGECLVSSDLLERNQSLGSWLNLSSFRCRVVGTFQGWALSRGESLITGFPVSGVTTVKYVLEIKVKGSREALKGLSRLINGSLVYLGPSEELLNELVKRREEINLLFKISLTVSAIGVAFIRWLEVGRNLKQIGLLISQGVGWRSVFLQELLISFLVTLLSFLVTLPYVGLIIFVPIAVTSVGSAAFTLWAQRNKFLGELL